MSAEYISSPDVEIRDGADIIRMRAREVSAGAERDRLWALSVEAFPPYADYQGKTNRLIPVFIAEPA